jgi:hypothetical protein
VVVEVILTSRLDILQEPNANEIRKSKIILDIIKAISFAVKISELPTTGDR